jgi:hypothetical protein
MYFPPNTFPPAAFVKGRFNKKKQSRGESVGTRKGIKIASLSMSPLSIAPFNFS